ncbi:TetR/AcrR family transcriptional regulator [Phytoactinopolyspora mesophila]|uniref:TetR family transcriptional regulator n=1 Tax=Phytoactinopolyspora mesophila TaxID=2650750 RepID=A0A7K3M5E8_9ACTN|nr:TetR/AcrR family transcriptional regulator [Phytoactinopolyspora mesophila]NDL58257.1 TetR family transcriptional regulator [Phytoactinopolyspora mesophila]
MPPNSPDTTPRPAQADAAPRRRLRRAERREQIIDAATKAFAREGGYSHTNLDDVAAVAGVTRMILYRHFDSKTDLYQAVIDRAGERMYAAAVVDGEMDDDSVARVIQWARDDPNGFRILFRHAAREPDFQDDIEQLKASMVTFVRPYLEEITVDHQWTGWTAHMSTVIIIEAIMAWLDTGQPDPEHATDRILDAVGRAVEAIASV